MRIKRGTNYKRISCKNYASKYFDVEINVKQIENFMEVVNNETI